MRGGRLGPLASRKVIAKSDLKLHSRECPHVETMWPDCTTCSKAWLRIIGVAARWQSYIGTGTTSDSSRPSNRALESIAASPLFQGDLVS